MSPEILYLAFDLESQGFAGRDAAVGKVVRAARVAGLSPVLVDILADPGEPEAARFRAFGRIAGLLSRRTTATDGRGEPLAA